MKKILTLMLVAIMAMFFGSSAAKAQVKAFPGASGWAENVTGGRGGKVYYVTSLKDCSDDNLVPGTFRWALRSGDNKPRTVLFAVNGTIYLESKLKTNKDNVSILGQSAPGGGVCITGYPLNVTNRNYIIRYIRFRAGDIPARESSTGDMSFSGLDVENAVNVILDHCSVTWSMEECLTMFDNDTTTVQNCIIGEGLYHSFNPKTQGSLGSGRAFAMQWGGDHSNMHHVLITNCNGRAPRFNGVREAEAWLPASNKQYEHDCHIDGDFANNVFYNWGGGHLSYYGGEFYASYFENAPAGLNPYNKIYMRNNYFRPGPSTKVNGSNYRHFFHPSGDVDNQIGLWYLNGNKFELSSYYVPSGNMWTDAQLKLVNDDNYYQLGTQYSALDLGSGFVAKHVLKSLDGCLLSTYQPVSADEAYKTVTDKTRGSGACLPRYDEEDQRLIDDAGGRNNGYTPFHGGQSDPQGTSRPGIIDTQADITFNNGMDTFTTAAGNTYDHYPSLALKSGEKYAVDSDSDGMPDAYEDAKGFDKTDADDGTAVAINGYTNLENYLNGLADFTLSNADYQTSVEYVEPGSAVKPESVTLTFICRDADVEGTVPAAMTIKYGEAVTFTNTKNMYKDGYTWNGWSDGSMVYKFGTKYEGYFIKDATLTPSFSKNTKNLSDRTDDVTVTWSFTSSQAPKLSEGKSGVFTALADIDGTRVDAKLAYDGMTLTVPATEGSTATIIYTSGASSIVAAVGDKITLTATSADIKSITVTYPFIVDLSDKYFHPVQVGHCAVGTKDYTTVEGENTRTWPAANDLNDSRNFSAVKATNYELIYGNLSTIHSDYCNQWMETKGQERDAYRNVINPNGDDVLTYSGSETTGCKQLNGFIVGQQTASNSYKLYAYVKDCAKVRTYASGSGSGGDFMQVIAIPADGSERITANNLHKLYKGSSFSEYFDIDLDPNTSYRLEWSSVGGVDMMVGAVKLYDKTAVAETSGDAVVMWDWNKESNGIIATVNGVVDPARAFSSATSSVGIALKTGKYENGNDPDGNQLYVAGISQTAEATAPQADHMVEFKIAPKAGFTFTPSQVDFTREFKYQGTGQKGQIDVYFKYGDEDEVYIRRTQATSATTSISVKSSTASFTDKFKTTTKPMYIRLYLYNMPLQVSNIDTYVKIYGVKISGTWQKSQAQKHTFTTTVTPENAGVVTQSPKGTAFVAESEITLTATSANGYIFDNWSDTTGTVLSKDATFTYTMPDADVNLKANFIDLSTFGYLHADGIYNADVKNAEELTIALKAATQATGRYRIFLHNGIYDFGTTAMTAVPQNTSLVGESETGVVLVNTPSKDVTDYQNETPVLFIDQNQNDTYFQDITIRAGRDWTAKTSQGQELAMRQRGKRAIYKNVSMQGVQDTYYLNKSDGSAYFEDCDMAGEVDFIYGDGTMYFKNCNLLPVSSSAKITAANTQPGYKGIVFEACTIDKHPEAKDGVAGYALGRPWGDSPCVTYLDTWMKVLPCDAGWVGMASGCVIRYHEFDSRDKDFHDIDLSKRSIAGCSPADGSDACVIDYVAAQEYTLEKTFATVAPDWNPMELAMQLKPSAPVIDATAGKLGWEAVDGAYAYAIVKDGNVVDFTKGTVYPVTDITARYSIRVANNMGGLSNGSSTAVPGTVGINEVRSEQSVVKNSAYYNIAGQRVSASHSGIVIHDGKKLTNK